LMGFFGRVRGPVIEMLWAAKKEGPNSLGGACPGLREEIKFVLRTAKPLSGDGLLRHPSVRRR
jgi:hypothetical protein